MEQQPAWPPGTPVSAFRVSRPGSVTATGVILIALGALIGLVGLIFTLGGMAWSAIRASPEIARQYGQLPESFGLFILVLGIVLLAWATTELLAGIFAMRGRTWARIAGIVVGILGALAGIAGVVPGNAGANALSLSISSLFAGAHVYVIWVLVSTGGWFAAEDRAAEDQPAIS
jgi:hypothetical protein